MMGWIRWCLPARRVVTAVVATALASATARGQTAPGLPLKRGVDKYRKGHLDRAIAEKGGVRRLALTSAMLSGCSGWGCAAVIKSRIRMRILWRGWPGSGLRRWT
jgi:hypothetical protein